MGPQPPRDPHSWLGRLPRGSPDPRPAFAASGHLRLAVLPEDRLQMKWRESEGSSLGYLVQVKPRAGRGPRLPSARTDGGHGGHGARRARLLATLPPSSPPAPLTRGSWGRRAGPLKSPPPYPRAWRTQEALTHLEETGILLKLRALRALPVPSARADSRYQSASHRRAGGRGAWQPGTNLQTG